MCQERFYRQRIQHQRYHSFRVAVMETDLMIYARRDLTDIARESVLKYRGYIESYISRYPVFASALNPWSVQGLEPMIIQEMADCARTAGVGPMAAVAGAIAQAVGQDLLQFEPEVIVENGGDIFLRTAAPVTIGVYAGKSPLSMKLGIILRQPLTPMGVCASSGTVGHSLSLGLADAVCVVSESCTLADAAATAIGNRVKTDSDIPLAIDFGAQITGVSGILIIKGKKLGAWGEIEIAPIK